MKDEKEKMESLGEEAPAQMEERLELNTDDTEQGVNPEIYPLRESSDDPRWAVRIVKIWIGFVIAALIFILTLLVLGAIYD
jgi:hypothetical protein